MKLSYYRLLPLALTLALANPLAAQTLLYWDTNGSNPGATDGTTADGIWDVNQTTNWNVSSSGDAFGTRSWVQGSQAIFAAGTNATGSSLITIAGSFEIPSLVVEEGNWTFSDGSLALSAGAYFDIATGSTATFDATIKPNSSGFLTIEKRGGGNLTITSVFSESPNWTDAIISDGGILIFRGAGAVGTDIGRVFVGRSADGNLSVVDGASFSTNTIFEFQVGATAGVSGTLAVSGTGSTLQSNTSALDVGFNGTGTLNVTDGGMVTSASCALASMPPGWVTG